MADSEFEYEILTPGEQAAAIRARLEGLERDLFNVQLDVDVAGPGANPSQEARAEALRERVEYLRERVSTLESA